MEEGNLITMERRIITTDVLEEDVKIEGSLRPQHLDDYIGQEKAKHDEFYKKYAEECEKRYALERKLEQIMNLINA